MPDSSNSSRKRGENEFLSKLLFSFVLPLERKWIRLSLLILNASLVKWRTKPRATLHTSWNKPCEKFREKRRREREREKWSLRKSTYKPSLLDEEKQGVRTKELRWNIWVGLGLGWRGVMHHLRENGETRKRKRNEGRKKKKRERKSKRIIIWKSGRYIHIPPRSTLRRFNS